MRKTLIKIRQISKFNILKKIFLKKVMGMDYFDLTQLVIKPALVCNANCPTCIHRRDLHRKLIKNKQLSLEDWNRIIIEAKKLGCSRLMISGGEPTLYKELVDLVKIGNKQGFYVSINSNGSLITEDFAKNLLDAGLNEMMISLYAPNSKLHDEMKGSKGIWNKAVSAVKIFSTLSKNYPSFRVCTQTILSKKNISLFDKILELHYNLGSCQTYVSYLEGDFGKKNLPTEIQIANFRENIMPKTVNFCKKLDNSINQKASCLIESIFSDKMLKRELWAEGVYKNKKRCRVPEYFALILANGDVHPCNFIEYGHEPVMGNLFKNSLTEIWRSEKWNLFRKSLHKNCDLCPMTYHLIIPLRKTGAENSY